MAKNKKSILSASLAVLLLVGAGSLAYFTDRAEGTVANKAGTVTLTELADVEGNDNMAPGDVVDVNIASEYTGSLDAKARIVVKANEDFAAADAEEGFVLKNADGTVQDLSQDLILDLGTVSTNDPLATDLKVELLAKSGNSFQDKGLTLEYVVEVMQDAHTTWTQVEDGAIDIVEAK